MRNPFGQTPADPGTFSLPAEGPISPVRVLADGLSQGIPGDEADPSVLDLGAGLVPIVFGALYTAALAAYQGALDEAASFLVAAHAAVGRAKAPAREAKKALRQRRKERKGALAQRAAATRLLAGRQRRSKLTKRKALLVTVGVVGGEICLNASAAIGVGDVPWLSVLAFTGVGAATLGVGMLAGPLRNALDQRHYATDDVPAGAQEAGVAHYFAPARGLRGVGALCGGVLVLSAVALGLAVGVLRQESGTTALFGLFTAITLIGAGAICFVAEDPVRDLFENLDANITSLDSEISQHTDVIGTYDAARATHHELCAKAEHHALAQWNLALEIGYLGLPPHLVGHVVPERLFVVSPEDYLSGPWRGLVGTSTPDTTPTEANEAVQNPGSPAQSPAGYGSVEIPTKESSVVGTNGNSDARDHDGAALGDESDDI